MPLSSNEVIAVAMMGITAVLDPTAIAGSGFILDPAYYVQPPSPPPPPPPSPIYGGGTSAGNIALTTGNWLNVRPYWDYLQDGRIEAHARGSIRVKGKTTVVVVPLTKETLDLPWQQIRHEDDLLLGVMDTANTPLLKQAVETLDERILKQDDLLLLLGGLVEKPTDDEEVILFI